MNDHLGIGAPIIDYPSVAREILGAKLLAEMVHKVWDEAPDDVKKELAARIVSGLALDPADWTLRSSVSSKVAEISQPLVDAYVKEHEDDIKQLVATAFKEKLASVINQTVGQAAGAIVKRLADGASNAVLGEILKLLPERRY